MNTIIKKRLLLYLLLLLSYIGIAQVTSGKIVYERKTNLYKKLKGDWVKEYIREAEKNKMDYFELYFNDTMSVFKPQESELQEEMSWATRKNTVVQNFKANYRLTHTTIWGDEFFIEDSLRIRQWKITDSKRKISGYECRKAVWQANDSTRIYAWYCDEIVPNVGPESFYGLPGAIMGLATEDGGVIYFAKSVTILNPDFQSITPKKSKKKTYTSDELKAKIQKQFGREPWGKTLINDTFGIW